MALVQPFHVPRWPFLRDVGFFTCAVMILVACLKDGKLTLPETGGLVGMYVLYVGIVVGGNWWHARRKQEVADRGKAVLGQDEQREDYFSQRGSMESRRPSAATLEQTELLKPTDAFLTSRSRSVSNASAISTGTTPLPLSRQSSHGTITHAHHTHGPRPQIDAPRPTFSLLGAIEFRDAINALRKESAAAAAADQGRQLVDAGQLSGQLDDLLGEPSVVADYFGGASPYPSGHYHSFAHGHGHHHSRAPGGRSPSRPAHSRQVSSTFRRPEAEQGTLPTLGARRLEPARVESTPAMAGGNLQARVHDVRRASADAIRDLGRREGAEEPTHEQAASTTTSLRDVEPDSIPLISSGNTMSQPKQADQPTWQRTAHHVLHILFPALQGFREKSIPGKILGIFASPAILALTLTLPVVDDSAEGVALNQGGVALGEDDEAATNPEEDSRFGMQADAERGIVHHTFDASGEDSQTVMGQAGWDLHRRVLAPGEVGSPDGDKDAREDGEACSVESEEEVLLFNKYLTAVQSVLGTLFCSWVIFCKHPRSCKWPELIPPQPKIQRADISSRS